MALYMLEYDLRKARDYQPLYDELARFNARRVLYSLWAFERINTNPENLRNHFHRFIDPDDGLIVMEVADWASIRVLALPKKAA